MRTTHVSLTVSDGFVMNGVQNLDQQRRLGRHFYVVFAKTDVTAGARGITAFYRGCGQHPGLQ